MSHDSDVMLAWRGYQSRYEEYFTDRTDGYYCESFSTLKKESNKGCQSLFLCNKNLLNISITRIIAYRSVKLATERSVLLKINRKCCIIGN